ncbi:SAVED domain-containing protein [Longimicrobium terrae]|uniref:SMODS-associated and fused to various effectors domain-containing protein n=1 Tax=Longimicrobium terrae TaxID=1639882 RepID=A0A841GXG8_9BACT|nr:SAVED domain-containing protein [Longimicrobium terrae]MBB4635970.1 hypothetical protein [Longimicrobium terrae]MBB6070366.1 hypothetical protein [Longimicrobium terrae]NNC30863.1 SAVED domain-containing protein [Longimicrobium terrae]
MSITTIPQKARFEVWLRAGGRCQYAGCNQALWRDDLTLQRMNRSYLAHIVADSADGPRGDPELSHKLNADPANIMLLCDTHHRLVDVEDVAGHPAELLVRYKREHEERIERQTAIQTNRRTELLLLSTRIADRQGLVNFEQAREAVVAEERYPASDLGIRIELASLDVDESDPVYWTLVPQLIDRKLQPFLSSLEGPTGYPINHLSIFALAPIPVLIYLGKTVGDVISGDAFQRHRNTNHWIWQELSDIGFNYTVLRPESLDAEVCKVAVNLSLCGTIHPSEIERAVGESLPTYTMTIAQPRPDFLKAKEQLELFRNEWRQLLGTLREQHGENCEVHLFPAVPNAIAVEIGRSLLPKVDPRLVIYDPGKMRSGFAPTLTF